ncbi:hypothetical protein [Hominifimenecus sp. rT4P-3]|uniref:hypothetical protein n=1 Tax=Hominifimenecus sp. rT4P-3 TaxID=3242979 RepID=UPI003DA57B3C
MSSLQDKTFSVKRKEQKRKLTINSPRPQNKIACVFAGKISEGVLSASLTIEAALVITMFLLVATCFLGIYPAIQIGLEIQAAVETVGEEMAVAIGVARSVTGSEIDTESLAMGPVGEWMIEDLTLAGLQERVINEVGRERLENSCVCEGAGGLSFLGSSWTKEGDQIKIRVSYRVRLPFSFGGLAEFFVIQRSCRRAWTGTLAETSGGGKEDALAYVTENGSVYHCSMDCTYLNLSISELSFDTIGGRRNQGGGKYKPCERCAKYSGSPVIVWITREGNRYHTDRACGGLKRSVRTISKTEAEVPPCSRCCAEEGEKRRGAFP